MNTKHLLVGLALFCMTPSFAQDQSQTAKPMTLQEAVTYALEHNEDVKKASYDEQIAQQVIRETKSNGLPQLNATGGVDYFPAIPTQILPGAIVGKPGTDVPVKFGKDYNAKANLQLTQLLFSKSYFVGLQAAKSSQDLYRLRKEMTQEEVIYNVSSSYFQILQTKEQFENINANLARLVQLEKILQLQYENDLVKKVDVNRIKVNRTNLENQKQTLTTLFEQQKNYLKFFMGMPLDQEVEVQNTSLALENVDPATISVNEAITQKTQYQLLQKQKQLTDYKIQNTRAGYYPTLSAYGQYGYQTQRDELFNSDIPWFKSAVVGLQVNVPIFDGFRKNAQVKQAQLEIRKIDSDIAKYNTNTAVQLTNAVSQLQNSQSSIAAQEKNVALAQEVYDTTNSLYKEGLAPLTDLLNGEVSLREAKTSLNNEILKYQLAQLNYLQAKGELTSLTK
ncbi:TolC family protein [Pontibacter ruber]|nr:TolC family protein [Pontibacter ruber]